MRRSTAIAVTSAVLLIGASTAVAAPQTGVVLACVNTSNGDVRITADACRTSETPLSWNQTGPEGPQGAQGPAGPTGPQGPQGPAGPPLALGAGSVSGEAAGSAVGATGNLRLATVTGNGDNLPGADGNLAEATVGQHNLVNGAIGTGKLADGAVTSGKIANGAVGFDQLARGQIFAEHLADGAVIGSKIRDGAIETAKLADGSVATSKLADRSVSSGKIANGAVGSGQLASSAVTGDRIAAGAIEGRHLAPGVANIATFTADLPDVPAGGSATTVLGVPGGSNLSPFDLFTITPSLSAPPAEGVFIIGSDILSPGQVTIRLFNATATNVPTQSNVSFTIRWVDLTS